MNRSRRRAGGFTLVEVMVALAVVAIALPAVIFALFQQIDGTTYLRDKSLAHMVAANKLTEIRLIAEATRQLPQGEATGVEELAGRQWFWTRRSQQTELPEFYRIEIIVGAGEVATEERLASLIAFMSADLRLDQTATVGEGG